ncbi:MAG: phosphate ABC transporter permease subunit PstC [Syntrophorhabdus aromaticivorans]|uniref:Phosphate transport system permease protein n=2 Tax=Syntrophorhabdus aromaticivorans TaxID=328301 RepID=A0A351TZL1_9BACT|nr:phosphate ABC transporter permease subunit PstC [Syntrophorhabdus aromaticivorans]HBA53142.1 phosphate ABC transporter permease subunit PstC [Syntrophorhabdus aromaticivorans]
MDKSERRFNGVLLLAAVFVVVLLLAVLATLLVASVPAIKAFGLTFFWGTTWDAAAERFGALPFLLGTLVTSFMAILICIPFSIAISLFLGEYFKEGAFSTFLRSSIEVLAGIPSVIYGLWGLFFLMPIMRAIEMRLGVTPHGVGLLTSALILTIMIIPFSASIGREVITLVPADLKEAAFSLGATRFEVIKNVIIPYARSGIIAGILLSLGRAIGETMAVTMLIGNSNFIPTGIFDPSNTMASVIANEFAEATGITAASLIYVALVLFLVTTVVNIVGMYVIKKVALEASKEVT